MASSNACVQGEARAVFAAWGIGADGARSALMAGLKHWQRRHRGIVTIR
jgi:hypothetical protein